MTANSYINNLQNIMSNLRKWIQLAQSQRGVSMPTKVSNTRIMQIFGDDIHGAASRYGVPANILANLIQAESGGNPNAVSPKGARGLTQIMPATEKGEGLSTATPKDQIYSGAQYLSKMFKLAGGNMERTLAAYNAGPSRLKNDAWKNIPETVNYVKKVMGR